MVESPTACYFRGKHDILRYSAHFTHAERSGVELHIHEAVEWTLDKTGETRIEEQPKPIAVFFVQWDGCLHCGLRDEELQSNWYHNDDMGENLKMLQWGWNLCVDKLRELDPLTEVRHLDIIRTESVE